MAGFLGRRDLEKHGRRARARVLETIKLLSSTSSGRKTSTGLNANVHEKWKVRIRVEPEGEAPFELETKISFPRDDGRVREGLVFPVLYDPEDPEKIEYDPAERSDVEKAMDAVETVGLADKLPAGLDLEGLMTEWKQDPQAARDSVRAQFGSQAAAQFGPGAAGFPVSGVPGVPAQDPVDRLAKLADLRDRGALTDAEFEAQKARILGES